ncbi:hypothetical protein K432DRAFT_274329, partial [Lepidopterella palustris CBS 459.81]
LQNEQSQPEPEPKDDPIRLHTSPAASSSVEDLGPKNLWDEAYNVLREKDAKLIDAYEKDLLTSQNPHQQADGVGGADRQVQLQELVNHKLQGMQNAQLKIVVSGKEVVVKEQVRKVVHAILSAKDFIGSAVSAEPHAALAWAGVLVVLPILLNPVTQDDDAMEGLGYISDLLIRCKVTEDTYLAPSTRNQSTSQHLRDLNNSFKAKTIELYSQILKYQIQLTRQYSRSGLFRFLRDCVVADDWNIMLADLKKTEENINKDLRAFGSNTLKLIDDKVSELQNQADKSWALLMDTKAGVETTNQTLLLGKLPRAEYAAFNTFRKNEPPPPECLENTRVKILSQIQDWGKGHGDECIFWLNGMAGTGKSTIARTVAHRFHKEGRLGASFFFSRGKKDLSDAAALFTTLAVQLTEVLPDLKRHVCDAITEHGDIGQQSLSHQWKHLILRPLLMLGKGLLPSLVLVFVIDALDECGGHENLPVILRLLTEVRDLTVVRIRVFITSRPETPIHLGFHEIPEIVHYDLMLHSIPQSVIKHDISIFLRYELAKINNQRSLGDDWPGEENIQKLVQKADRLFIYAATACRFLSKSKHPKSRLSEMLEVNSASHSSTKELDKMYMLILKNLIIEGHDEDNEDTVKLFKHIVGSIIILFDTLSTVTLTKLLAVASTEMNETLEPLRSVLNVAEEETSPIQLFHLSFREFLLNPQRCSDTRFRIDEEGAHNDLFVRCLKVMSNHLKRDMCNLQLPGALCSEVEKSKVEECLPLDVQYACRYWVQHLQRSKALLHDDGQVHVFLREHLLHWLEALSLIGKTSEGVRAITSLESLAIVSDGPNADRSPYLHAFIHDAKRFAHGNGVMIENAPLQIYCSALVFAPVMSLVRKQFSDQMPRWICRLPEVQKNWSSSLQTLEGHSEPVRVVAFSPDGKLVASASDD